MTFEDQKNKEKEEDKAQSEENFLALLSEQDIRRKNAVGGDASVSSSPPIWLISFTDVIALMLTFFVLLYSMSAPDLEKWDSKIGVTAQATARFSGARNNAGNQEGLNLSRLSFAEAENLDYLEILFEDVKSSQSDLNDFNIIRRNDFLMLVFSKTRIENIPENRLFYNQLTPLLKSLDNQINLIVTSKIQNGFSEMQNLGKLFRQNGYNRPMTIQSIDNLSGVENGFAISIRPHNGQRINR